MDNEAARQIAKILDIPVWTIITNMEAQKQKDPSKKKAWKMLSKMTKQAEKTSTKLLITLPFLSYLITVIVYYVKLTTKEQYT